MDNIGWYPTFREEEGDIILGYFSHVFLGYTSRPDGTTFWMGQLRIYEDGHISLNEEDFHIDQLPEFEERLRDEHTLFRPVPEDGTRVVHLARMVYRVSEMDARITLDDVMKDICDVWTQIRGGSSANDRCIQSISDYLAAPGPDRLARLREAYEAVPAYMRVFIGSMDAKDRPLRALLGANSDAERAEAEAILREEWT